MPRLLAATTACILVPGSFVALTPPATAALIGGAARSVAHLATRVSVASGLIPETVGRELAELLIDAEAVAGIDQHDHAPAEHENES